MRLRTSNGRIRLASSSAVALMMLGAAACGGEAAPTASPASERPSSSPSPLSSPPAAASSAAGSGDSAPTGAARGIDTVAWPGDEKGAQALFDRMPDEIADMRVKRPRFYGAATGVVYGPNDRGITAWVQAPDKEMAEARMNLAVMFGMQLACRRGTYAGTAAQSRWGGGPDIDRKGEFGPDDGLWWFSCTFIAGESRTFTGHAIGWVSGDLAWLVTTPDKETARLTIEAMIQAAGS